MTFIFKDLSRRKKFLRLGILITGIALVVIAFITFYGQNVGNFVLSIDDELKERKVWMSTDPNFTVDTEKGINNKEEMLTADPVTEARDITYSNIKIKEALLYEKKNDNGTYEGSYTDPDFKYIAYRFYIQNQGENTVKMTYELSLNHVKKDVDKAIRIMVFAIPDPEIWIEELRNATTDQEIDELYDGKQSIYMAPDVEKNEKGDIKKYPDDLFYDRTRYPEYPKPNDVNSHEIRGMHKFETDRMVFKEATHTLVRQQKIMFAVFMWLEGQDPDTTNNIVGGKVKIQMRFSAVITEDKKNG